MATAMQQDVSEKQIRPVENQEPAPPSRRRFILPIVAVLVLIALIWAFKQWSYSRAHESTDDAAVDGHLIPVLAKVSGYVQKVTVQDNSHVKSDSMLVLIDPSEYQVRLAQAQADLAAAQATAGSGGATGQAEAQVATASSQHAALGAQIDAARANAQKAHQDLERYRQLAAQQIVSKLQLDAAQAAAQTADANVAALERQSAAAGASVTNAEAGVRLAEARLQAARAARDNAQLQLEYTRVGAPAPGIVSRKQVEVGQLVQVGQPLLTMVADTGVFVTANMKETQLADLCRSTSSDRRRRVRRCERGWRRGKPRRGNGIEVRVATAGQRNGEFHEGRAARARSHSHHEGPRPRPATASRHVRQRARGHEELPNGEQRG